MKSITQRIAPRRASPKLTSPNSGTAQRVSYASPSAVGIHAFRKSCGERFLMTASRPMSPTVAGNPGMPLTFELLHTDAHSQARLGRLHTPAWDLRHAGVYADWHPGHGQDAAHERPAGLWGGIIPVQLLSPLPPPWPRPHHAALAACIPSWVGHPPFSPDSGVFKCSVSGPWRA